jgi:hypothetical protein
MTDQRGAIAYHEAGHAVISMELGYRCLYVTIIPDGDRLGHVCCENPLVGGNDHSIEHALKVLISARLAEGKYTGSREVWGDAGDRVKATNIALLATDQDTDRAEALINEMIGETRGGRSGGFRLPRIASDTRSRRAGFSRRSAVAVSVPPSGPTRYRYRGAYHFRIRGWVYAVAVRALRQAKSERLINTVAGLHDQHCRALPCAEHRCSGETPD